MDYDSVLASKSLGHHRINDVYDRRHKVQNLNPRLTALFLFRIEAQVFELDLLIDTY